MAGITAKVLYTRMGSLRNALEAAGLEVTGAGFAQTEAALLLDCGGVAQTQEAAERTRIPERGAVYGQAVFHALWIVAEDARGFPRFCGKPGHREGVERCAGDDCRPASRRGESRRGRLGEAGSQGRAVMRPSCVWAAAADGGAGACSGERTGRGVCFWGNGAAAGVYCPPAAGGVSGLYCHARDGSGAVAAGED
ncbi:MAG TPA: hypothetical protein VGK22_04915 [Candidatus Angelobacter sp.]